MAFASLFSGPPNQDLPVADCASDEREEAGADEAEIAYEVTMATEKKNEKKNEWSQKNWGGNIDYSSLQHIPATSPGGQLGDNPRVPRKNEWHWDYNLEHTEGVNLKSVNPRKRKQASDDLRGPKKQDFASELDQYRRVREAQPPKDPPVPVPKRTGGWAKKKKKKKKKKMNVEGQENPGDAEVQKRNQEMPGPGQKDWAQGGGGRGRGGGARGRGSRNDKPHGRNCGNGRGRKGCEGKARPQEERKKVFLSQDYLERHTVEAQGRHICKYFLRGTCVRGDKCNFEHDMNVKKMEVCKFYVQGFCMKENCIYMHKEFPCRFFHTGAKCYQGDVCRFSHEPLSDLTRELLERSLNPTPVTKEEPGPMKQDSCSSSSCPLPPSPPPPVAKVTVDVAHDKVTVKPTFYNSSPLSKGQPQATPALPQPGGGLNTQGVEVPVGSPSLERRVPMSRPSPAVPDTEMERNATAAWDQTVSVSPPAEEGPKPTSSVLKTLFLHLCPAEEEEPQNSDTETGGSAGPHDGDEGADAQSAALMAMERQTLSTVSPTTGTSVCDWRVDVVEQSSQHEAESSEVGSAPLYKPLSSLDQGEREVGEEEGRLRDEPVLVPLEPIPGITRRDPRSAPYAAAVLLPLPPFARAVEWNAEVPIPPPPRNTEEPIPPPPQLGTSPRSVGSASRFQRPLVDAAERSSCSRTPSSDLDQVVSSAVHRLPVPALARLIQPTHTSGRGVRPGGGGPAARETQANGNVLKGLFKTLLPASDPSVSSVSEL